MPIQTPPRRLNSMSWPHTNITSDGASVGDHPRGYGSFPRAIRKYSREQPLLRLEEMIAKMTSQAAANVGIENRGLIKPGLPADLVLFTESGIADQATIENSDAPAVGIHGVWVNGVLVWDGSNSTGLRPGVYLPRSD